MSEKVIQSGSGRTRAWTQVSRPSIHEATAAFLTRQPMGRAVCETHILHVLAFIWKGRRGQKRSQRCKLIHIQLCLLVSERSLSRRWISSSLQRSWSMASQKILFLYGECMILLWPLQVTQSRINWWPPSQISIQRKDSREPLSNDPICITPCNCKIKSPFGFSVSGGQQRSWRTCPLLALDKEG